MPTPYDAGTVLMAVRRPNPERPAQPRRSPHRRADAASLTLERRLAIAGADVNVLESGVGTTVLLLHGFGDSINTWRDVIPDLARRHHCVAADLPGFGDSGPAPPGVSLLEHYADVVDGLIEHTGASSPVAVVGNSMGGAVALTYALRRPDRVTRLVLVGCAGLGDGVPRWWRLVMGETLPLRLLMASASFAIPAGLLEQVAAAVYSRLVFHRATAVEPERIAGFSRHYRTRHGVERLFRLGRVVIDELDGDLRVQAAALPTPTLLLWGREDRLVPVAHATALHAAMSSSRLHVLDGCGHCPQVERPKDFLAAVTPFLRGRGASPRRGATVLAGGRIPG